MKKPVRWTQLVLLITAVFVASPLFGSGKEGHGGSAVVCRDVGRRIVSVELLDLYEAREQYKLTVANSNLSPQKQAYALVDRSLTADQNYFDKLPGYVDDVIAKLSVLNPGVGVKPVNDVFPAIFPKNCGIEPLANYQDDGTVLVDGDLYPHLSPTGKAGLYLHEALYRLERETESATDSRKARRINGYLFSTLTDDAFTAWFGRTHGDLVPDPSEAGEDLKIQEAITGLSLPGDNQTEAQKNLARQDYAKKCMAWKQATMARFKPRSKYVYAECGQPEEHWSRSSGIWGFQVVSLGTIRLRPKGKTLTLHDTIRVQLVPSSDPQNIPPVAIQRYQTACSNWLHQLEQRWGADLFYSNCGEMDDGPWIANSYYTDENGSQRANWLGWEPSSQAQFIVFVHGEVSTDEESIQGQRYYFNPGDIPGEANAFQWARYDYALKCNQFKADASSLYVDCETGDVEIQDHPYATSYTIIDNNYWMRGTAKIYRLQ